MDKFVIRYSDKKKPDIPAPIPSQYKNETWLNLYGFVYRDLKIIDIDEGNMSEFNVQFGRHLEASLEDIDIEDAQHLLQGIRSLKSMIAVRKYPSTRMTLIVLSVLKKAMTKDVDETLIMEAAGLVHDLLRFIPPMALQFRDYWNIVFVRILTVNDRGDSAVMTSLRLREMFIEIMSSFCDKKTTSKSRQLASNAFLKILVDYLEIDFFRFLNEAKDLPAALFTPKYAPCISGLFWPYRMTQIDGSQDAFLKPILQTLISAKDMGVYNSCVRLLAMIFEMIRVTDKQETADVVALHKTPEKLQRLLSDIPSMSRLSVLEELHGSIAFGWLKEAVEERMKIKIER